MAVRVDGETASVKLGTPGPVNVGLYVSLLPPPQPGMTIAAANAQSRTDTIESRFMIVFSSLRLNAAA
jgi:hypothetical protein